MPGCESFPQPLRTDQKGLQKQPIHAAVHRAWKFTVCLNLDVFVNFVEMIGNWLEGSVHRNWASGGGFRISWQGTSSATGVSASVRLWDRNWLFHWKVARSVESQFGMSFIWKLVTKPLTLGDLQADGLQFLHHFLLTGAGNRGAAFWLHQSLNIAVFCTALLVVELVLWIHLQNPWTDAICNILSQGAIETDGIWSPGFEWKWCQEERSIWAQLGSSSHFGNFLSGVSGWKIWVLGTMSLSKKWGV